MEIADYLHVDVKAFLIVLIQIFDKLQMVLDPSLEVYNSLTSFSR